MSTTVTLPFDAPAAPRQGLGLMATTLVGSEILRIAGEVRAMREQGKAVLDLTVGDFAPAQFRIPEALEQGIARALHAGQTNYPPSDGVLPLRKAVQGFYADSFGLDYPLEGILVAGGARPLLWATYSAIVDPGDTVLYTIPSWNNNHYCHLTGAQAITVETRPEDGFLPTAEQLQPHVSKAVLLVLNSPLNPAGSGFRPEQLRAIAHLVLEENERRGPHAKPLFILYDQIYWLVAAASVPHCTPVQIEPGLARYTVHVDGISKAFAATGLRVGWAAGPPYLVARMRDLLGHVGAWAPRPEQVATAEILAQPQVARDLAGAVRDGIDARLGALDRGLRKLEAAGLPVRHLPPAGALYLSVQFDLVDRLGNNREIRKYLLDQAGFAVVPFHAFGTRDDNGWFRLSVGAVGVEEIAPALERVGEALARAVR